MRDSGGETARSSAEVTSRLASALAGRYTVEREIGRGGMATVYLVHDLRHDRQVALKVLVPSITNVLGTERFTREIRIAAALTHPHILPVLDSGEANGMLFYVMPFVEGESLRTRLEREQQLPIDDAVRITREVADALAFAHAHGVVHRDIKPENVLLAGGHALVTDFGIARAIHAVADGERRLTDSGVSVGTPLYMSPEQAVGEREIDGRADLYALGCVCFEMLTGTPPFSGANAQAVRMRHLSEPPPPIRSVRPTVPREIEDVVHRLLAKVPADRFETAGRLLETLPTTTTERQAFVARRRRPWWRLGVLAAVISLGAIALLLGTDRIGPFASVAEAALDPNRYAVMPLLEEGPVPPDLSGARIARDLADALGHWRGIEVVRDFRVRDLVARGRPPANIDRSADYARQLGAALVVWGDLRPAPGGVEVRAVMFRSADPDGPITEHSAFVPVGNGGRDSLTALAARLLTGTAAGGQQRLPTTSDWNAYSAYGRGQAALAEWNLPGALAELERAVELDPDYAEAYLLLAHVHTWGDQFSTRANAWRAAARRAAELKQSLSPADQPYAEALGAMADGRFEHACPVFDSLVRADSSSFEAWIGLGNCLRLDRAVVPDRRSPSRFSFRSSWQRAITAYLRALELVPSAHRAFGGAAFDRLQSQLLLGTPNLTRPGIMAAGNDTMYFAAFAALDGDTVALWPYPVAELFGGTAGPPAEAVAAAAAHNRDLVRNLTERWVDAFPSSPDAREAFARALEGLGEIASDGDERHSAFAQLTRARALATGGEQQLRLGEAEIRLLLKTEQFARAARLADSVLRAAPESVASAPALGTLGAMAALRGDARRAASFLRRAAPNITFTSPTGTSWTLHRPVAEPALTYLAYAAVGAPADTLRALEQAARLALERFPPSPAARADLTVAALLRPAMLAFPITGPGLLHRQGDQPVPLFTLQRKLMTGDTAGVRAYLDALIAERAPFRPGDVSIDEVHQEAELRLAIGDTAEAIALLDRSLGALPTLGFELVHHVAESAALVRAMDLRATLARRAGEEVTARRWASAVAALRGRPPGA